MVRTMTAVLVVALCGWTPQDEKENPAYKAWSKFKVGATATYKITITHGGQSADMEQTVKLVELTADKAVIEKTNPMANRTDKEEIPAKVQEVAKPTEEGNEELQVGDKKLKCHWAKYTKDDTSRKEWTCDQVPGGLVKLESEGAHPLKKTLTEFKAE